MQRVTATSVDGHWIFKTATHSGHKFPPSVGSPSLEGWEIGYALNICALKLADGLTELLPLQMSENRCGCLKAWWFLEQFSLNPKRASGQGGLIWSPSLLDAWSHIVIVFDCPVLCSAVRKWLLIWYHFYIRGLVLNSWISYNTRTKCMIEPKPLESQILWYTNV